MVLYACASALEPTRCWTCGLVLCLYRALASGVSAAADWVTRRISRADPWLVLAVTLLTEDLVELGSAVPVIPRLTPVQVTVATVRLLRVHTTNRHAMPHPRDAKYPYGWAPLGPTPNPERAGRWRSVWLLCTTRHARLF